MISTKNICFSVAAIFLFYVNTVAALTLDDFEETQFVTATTPGSVVSDAADAGSAVGGKRSLQGVVISGDNIGGLQVVSGQGSLRHSQDALVVANSVVTWDSDLDPNSTDSDGLIGIDLTQDGSDGMHLEVLSFDHAGGNSVNITFTIFDASDPTGNTWSSGAITLDAQVISLTSFELAFSDFNGQGPFGPADFTNVGAVSMFIDGSGSELDLSLKSVGTNGDCNRIPSHDRSVLDVCGVCDGNGLSCAGCDGVAHSGVEFDDCGICGGDNSTCLGCDGNPNSNKVVDRCGVCGGDGSSCLDCEGVFMGPAVLDQCKVCGGDGLSCIDCSKRDMFQTLTDLDGGAKKQEAIIKKILQKLGKVDDDPKTKRYIRRTRKTANDLQLANWRLSWTLPVISVQCDHTDTLVSNACFQDTNLDKVAEYQDRSEELRALGTKANRRLKRAREAAGLAANSTKRNFRRERRRLNNQHNTNVDLSETVDAFQSTCVTVIS